MRVSISLVSIALLSYLQTTNATGQLYARKETDVAPAIQEPASKMSLIGSHPPLGFASSDAFKGSTGYYSSLAIPSRVIQSPPSSKLPASSFSHGTELSSALKSASRSASHGTPFQVLTSASRGSTPGSHGSKPTILSAKPSEKNSTPAGTRISSSKSASHSAKADISSKTFPHSVTQSSKPVPPHKLSSSAFTVKRFVTSSPCTTKRTSYSQSHSTKHISSRKLTSNSSKSTYRPTSPHEVSSERSSAKSVLSSKPASHSTTPTKIWSRSHPRHTATSFMRHLTWSSKPLPQKTKLSRTNPIYSSQNLHSLSHSYECSSPPPFPTGEMSHPARYSRVPSTITKTYTRTTTIYPHPTTKCLPMPWPYPDCLTTTITKTVPWYTTVCSIPTTWVESTVTYSHTDYETSTYTVTDCPCDRPTTIYYYSTYSTTCTTPIPTTITVITPSPETSCYAETTEEISYSTISTETAAVSPATSAMSGVINSTSATASTLTTTASQNLPTFSSTASHGRRVDNRALMLLGALIMMMLLY
jgi:hypothetical protein